MTVFIITRHGTTDWNRQGKMQGVSDIPLSEEGRTQAEKLSKRLSEESIDAAYTSMLQRAYATAEKVLSNHPHVSLNRTPILDEMDWGTWEGRTLEEIKKDAPHLLDQRDKEKFSFAPPGGKSPKFLKERIIPFVEMLIEMHPDQTILIVGHNGINRVFVGSLLDWDDEKISKTCFENTSVTIIKIDGDQRDLHLFDCSKHLKDF